jgi:hypothetical protein
MGKNFLPWAKYIPVCRRGRLKFENRACHSINPKPAFMTPRVKSPVWAIVLLMICLILRFCDSWLFGEESRRKNFPRERSSRQDNAGKRKVNGKKPGAQARVTDSLYRESHFFR